MSCEACAPYFENPTLLTLGATLTPAQQELVERLEGVWETLQTRRSNPTSGLYVEHWLLRCRACDQRAEASDDAWYGGEFKRV